jgi:hypothetical protein
MGVPMIGLYWPPAWLAFVPVVLIETWWARRVFNNDWKKAIASTFVANLVSTIIGIPLAWFVWSTLELRFFGTALGIDNSAKGLYAVTVQAAWLIPYEQHLWWMVPVAAFVLTVVFFAGSVVVEQAVMARFQSTSDPTSARRWAWKGNLLSYSVIFVMVLAFLYVPRTFLDRAADRPVNVLEGASMRAAKWLSPKPAR